MPERLPIITLRLHLVALTAAVALDGGVGYLGAAIVLTLFCLTLLIGSAIEFRRPSLHRLRLASLVLGLGVVGWTAYQIHWDPSGAAVHSVWRHLAEEFGESGGVRATMRMEAVWSLPVALIPFAAFAAAIPIFRDSGSVRQFWGVVSTIGAIFAIYGALQLSLFPTWHFGERKFYLDNLTGFYVNRNVAAAFLSMASLATLLLLEEEAPRNDPNHLRRLMLGRTRFQSRDRRLLLLVVAFFVQITALFLTGSRAGVAFGAGGIAIFLYLRRKAFVGGLGWRPSRSALVIAGGVTLIVAALLAGRVGQRLDMQGLDDARWCSYPAMARMAWDNLPWGVGLGGFIHAYAGYRPAECGVGGVWDSAHDGYIQGLATLGLAFPVLVAAIFAFLLPPLLAASRADAQSRSAAQATLIACAILALHSLVDFPLEIPANAALLATMIAATIGLATRRRPIGRRRRTRSKPTETTPSVPRAD